MNPANGEETIFAEAQRLPPGQRAAYLDESTNGDAALRRRVEALLNAYEAGDFLEQVPASEVRQTINLSIPLTEKPGDRIGRYKLLQQIGEGGCGMVYMAEQEEPVRRRVALKVIKLGMDTKQVIARFEAERQALAMMDHPNIAKVLDAGATETGRPYFVMELVRGLKITDYCDEKKLSTRQRLDLFIQVCQAIQHAHQKGIIHRDIKPSNILVTINDGVAVPKVIDFGIAKATGGLRLTDKTVFTAFEQFIGTPAYMSPEQALLTSQDIDTRSDIYALGVLLYELLTGKTPFDTKELLAVGLDAMRRTICETDPPRPSTRLSTLPDKELNTTAQRRGLEPPKLLSQLRGDLDWIVMKALDKERARRYETANGFARDLQRFLNNEAVVARPPNALYRFQKAVRRNKLAFAASVVVVGALMLGLAISTWSLVAERQEHGRALDAEAKAKTEAAKSAQVAQFLKDMLNSVEPSVALGRDAKMLREILDKTAERVGNDLRDQPEVEAELRSILGTTYFGLGEYAKAEAMHREALRLRKARWGETNELVAESLYGLGLALQQQSLGSDKAEVAQRQALTIRRCLFTNDQPALASSLISLSDVLQWRNQLGEAEKLAREGAAMWRRLRPGKEADREVAAAVNALGSVLWKVGKADKAESVQREALEMWQKLGGNESPELATAYIRLTAVLDAQGKWDEAEEMHRLGLMRRRKVLGDAHPLAVSSFGSLASMYLRHGKAQEAEQLVSEALTNRWNLPPDERFAGTLDLLTLILRVEGKRTEAAAAGRKALDIRTGIAERGNAAVMNAVAWELATSDVPTLRDGKRALAFAEKAVASTNHKDPLMLDTLAAAYAECGEFPKAVSTQEEAIGLLQDARSKANYTSRLSLYQANMPFRQSLDDAEFAGELAAYASALLRKEKFVEAEKPARECQVIREKVLPDDWLTFNAGSMVGASLLGQGKYSEAETLLLSAYEGMKKREKKIPAAGKVRLKETIQRLLQLYETMGRADRVADWKAKLFDFEKAGADGKVATEGRSQNRTDISTTSGSKTNNEPK